MTAVNGWLIALLAVVAYFVVVVALYRTGRIGPDRALSLFGPALMLKTQRGKAFLDRIGRFRGFWTKVGDIGIALAAIAMVVIVALLVLDAIVATSISPSAAPPPQEALGLPGINPIIPLGYGIVALVVGVVLHELMHGIIARSQKIGVKSLGVLWFIVPIGAFVEQDDAEMMKAPRRKRDRVAAAGVLANFALTVVFFLLLASLVSTSVQVNANGVGVAGVVDGFPAQNASLTAGDIITSLNGTPTTTTGSLLDVLSHGRAGQTMPMTFYRASDGATVSTNVTLAPLSSYTGVASDSQKGFLGVAPEFLTPTELRGTLIWPTSSSRGPLFGLVDWLVLPLAGLEPMQGTPVQFFHFSGPLAGTDPGTAWILLNLLYWLAWMNLLLGLSNALPLYPLDGGLLFRDFSASIASRFRRGWDDARLERFGGRATAVSSLVVLGLLIWQFVAPHL
ncbi:MAG: site-2 protease family protein [Thermoplasmata archaeon]|nr:site-2 protease family protein [Thermoplasmata archaeon]